MESAFMNDLAFSKILEFPNDFVDQIWIKLLPEIKYLKRCTRPTSKRMFFCLDISSFYKNWTGPKTVKIDIELTNRFIETFMGKAGGAYCYAHAAENNLNRKRQQLEIKDRTIKINKIIKKVELLDKTTLFNKTESLNLAKEFCRKVFDNEYMEDVILEYKSFEGLINHLYCHTEQYIFKHYRDYSNFANGSIKIWVCHSLNWTYGALVHEISHQLDMYLHINTCEDLNDKADLGKNKTIYSNRRCEVFAQLVTAFEVLKRIRLCSINGKKDETIPFYCNQKKYDSLKNKTIIALKKGKNGGFFPKIFDIEIIKNPELKKLLIKKWVRKLSSH
jgi:hypothetical protein